MQSDWSLIATIRNASSIELEAWCWAITASLAESTDESDRAFLGAPLGEIKREIAHRERLADPLAPLRVSSARYDLERIKADYPLSEALPRLAAVDLRQSAGRFVGRCPFPDHHDGSPSLSVAGDGMVWHCFGCGRGGDLFSFGQQWYDTRSFIAAVQTVVTGMGGSLDRYRLDRPAEGSVRRVA